MAAATSPGRTRGTGANRLTTAWISATAAKNPMKPTTACHNSCLRSTYSFTPPAVSPATIRRWNTSTKITSGMVTIAPAAMIAA